MFDTLTFPAFLISMFSINCLNKLWTDQYKNCLCFIFMFTSHRHTFHLFAIFSVNYNIWKIQSTNLWQTEATRITEDTLLWPMSGVQGITIVQEQSFLVPVGGILSWFQTKWGLCYCKPHPISDGASVVNPPLHPDRVNQI